MSTATITPAMARHIEIWPTERLHAYDRNARTHSPEQVAQIAASIVEFGFLNPILVDSSTGIIVAGHGRLLAARKLGLAEVPVVVLDHLSETQRRAYVIADNRLALNAGWDEALLAEELGDLKGDGLDLGLVGFSDEELDSIFRISEDAPGPEEPAEEIPEAPVEAITRPGDIWLIGKHRVICGDCRDANVVRQLFRDARANVVITSPPYATQREYDPSSGFQPIRPEEYVAWYRDVAANIADVLAPDGSYFLNVKEHAEGARLAAARKLGMTEVPVIVLGHLTETQRRALVLADNKLALNAGWDEEMLRVELESLKEDNFNLDVVGFTDEELDVLLADPEQTHEGLTDEDAVPEAQEATVTVLGDLWLLGNHRLLCADSTVLANVEKVMGGGLTDMTWTDSPYNVNYGQTMKDKLRGKPPQFVPFHPVRTGLRGGATQSDADETGERIRFGGERRPEDTEYRAVSRRQRGIIDGPPQ